MTLHEAAQKNDTASAAELLRRGADKDALDDDGISALMVAAYACSTDVAKLLVEGGADMEATDVGGYTALMHAAQSGSTAVAKLLVQSGADMEAKAADGATAAVIARDAKEPNIFALLDPAAAAKLGDKLKDKFSRATLVHVISTRTTQVWPAVRKKAFDGPLSCNPVKATNTVKMGLENAEGVSVFDPNADNAYLMKGETETETANAIWLKNWLWALELARKTGGCCVQVVVKPGLSNMQEAEALMAADKGVRVVRLDCTEVLQFQTVNLEAPVDDTIFQGADERDLVQLEGWAELTALARQAAAGTLVKPLSHQELEQRVGQLEAAFKEKEAALKEVAELALKEKAELAAKVEQLTKKLVAVGANQMRRASNVEGLEQALALQPPASAPAAVAAGVPRSPAGARSPARPPAAASSEVPAGARSPARPSAAASSEVQVGDRVSVSVRGASQDAQVLKRDGTRLRLQVDDGPSMWAEMREVKKVD